MTDLSPKLIQTVKNIIEKVHPYDRSDSDLNILQDCALNFQFFINLQENHPPEIFRSALRFLKIQQLYGNQRIKLEELTKRFYLILEGQVLKQTQEDEKILNQGQEIGHHLLLQAPCKQYKQIYNKEIGANSNQQIPYLDYRIRTRKQSSGDCLLLYLQLEEYSMSLIQTLYYLGGQEKIKLLKKSLPFFSDINEKLEKTVQSSIVRIMRKEVFQKGQKIYSQRQKNNKLYLVYSGQFCGERSFIQYVFDRLTLKQQRKYKYFKEFYFDKYQFFGEECIFEEQNKLMTIECLQDGIIYSIHKSQLEKVLNDELVPYSYQFKNGFDMFKKYVMEYSFENLLKKLESQKKAASIETTVEENMNKEVKKANAIVKYQQQILNTINAQENKDKFGNTNNQKSLSLYAESCGQQRLVDYQNDNSYENQLKQRLEKLNDLKLNDHSQEKLQQIEKQQEQYFLNNLGANLFNKDRKYQIQLQNQKFDKEQIKIDRKIRGVSEQIKSINNYSFECPLITQDNLSRNRTITQGKFNENLDAFCKITNKLKDVHHDGIFGQKEKKHFKFDLRESNFYSIDHNCDKATSNIYKRSDSVHQQNTVKNKRNLSNYSNLKYYTSNNHELSKFINKSVYDNTKKNLQFRSLSKKYKINQTDIDLKNLTPNTQFKKNNNEIFYKNLNISLNNQNQNDDESNKNFAKLQNNQHQQSQNERLSKLSSNSYMSDYENYKTNSSKIFEPVPYQKKLKELQNILQQQAKSLNSSEEIFPKQFSKIPVDQIEEEKERNSQLEQELAQKQSIMIQNQQSDKMQNSYTSNYDRSTLQQLSKEVEKHKKLSKEKQLKEEKQKSRYSSKSVYDYPEMKKWQKVDKQRNQKISNQDILSQSQQQKLQESLHEKQQLNENQVNQNTNYSAFQNEKKTVYDDISDRIQLQPQQKKENYSLLNLIELKKKSLNSTYNSKNNKDTNFSTQKTTAKNKDDNFQIQNKILLQQNKKGINNQQKIQISLSNEKKSINQIQEQKSDSFQNYLSQNSSLNNDYTKKRTFSINSSLINLENQKEDQEQEQQEQEEEEIQRKNWEKKILENQNPKKKYQPISFGEKYKNRPKPAAMKDGLIQQGYQDFENNKKTKQYFQNSNLQQINSNQNIFSPGKKVNFVRLDKDVQKQYQQVFKN